MSRGLLALMLMLAACGPPGLSSMGDSGEQEFEVGATSDEGEPCPPGLTRCGDTCVNTEGDSEHCGACGNVCELEGPTGYCQAGHCTSVLGECIDEQSGFTSCSDYCASIGRECGNEYDEAAHPCVTGTYWFAAPGCPSPQYTSTPFEPAFTTCDDPLPFGLPFDDEVSFESTRCCCAQD